MNTYLDFVESIQAAVLAGQKITPSKARTEPVERAAKVLLFSPHPDDECITGVLPLRLMREADKQIINIPVTYGSNKDRQTARAEELADACRLLGWTSYRNRDDLAGLDTDDIAAILSELKPEIIFVPHVQDWNPRHISTHTTVVQALQRLGEACACTVIETEYWGAMDDPNLMVEADAQTVADLVAATALHVGEVARNPYHLLLPAWMQDNVRRGGELVGGPGTAPPPFNFATLYRLRRWERGGFVEQLDTGTFIAMETGTLKEIF
ncbi:MAG: PIG-L family deacetylase [Kiritimatiellia bacterium]|jgi:LmbE family N-acetylglucosaminyl deacetylase|nr:PIG-L family deacetylase [Kiritimatiellia bacterium]